MEKWEEDDQEVLAWEDLSDLGSADFISRW
jgi:hypothetical protein